MTEAAGPFPLYTLIYCRDDGLGQPRRAAFAEAAEARDHARRTLLARAGCWTSVVVARGVDLELTFIGAWDRDATGALVWDNADLA
ncbi:hypothetical protein [Phenylobacterium zucineum]|uniref:hypothetical protein n=1 Tax=Phenylobacterium zucineum TaxID=284016 RepID=UPI0002FD6CC2|nr:hypothetical protein [Phenylobacterium zucineum]